MKEIEKQILIVKEDMFNRFPDCPYTIRILLWDDYSTMVECRYGSKDKIHISRFYNNELKYEELEHSPNGKMFVGSDGLEYIPRINY